MSWNALFWNKAIWRVSASECSSLKAALVAGQPGACFANNSSLHSGKSTGIWEKKCSNLRVKFHCTWKRCEDKLYLIWKNRRVIQTPVHFAAECFIGKIDIFLPKSSIWALLVACLCTWSIYTTAQIYWKLKYLKYTQENYFYSLLSKSGINATVNVTTKEAY